MSQLSQEVALRIALAARALPDTEIKDLLIGLLGLVGEPLTAGKLNKVRLGKLKQIESLSEIDEEYLKQALGFLKGRNIETEPVPLPEIQAFEPGDMKDSVRVACASNQGSKIDGHFGSCARFLIFQVSSEESRLVDIRQPRDASEDEDKNAIRAETISDCQVLYTVSIGGPAAAKAVRAGLHPIKLPNGGEAEEVLQRLQDTLSGSPPPWLAKAMGHDPEQRARFKMEANA